MNSTALLTGSHLRTYNTIFQHPVSHNLEWRSVRSLLSKLGEVTDEPNGNMKATRNGLSLVLHLPRSKDVAETEELMAIRHFLEQSEEAGARLKQVDPDWLLVIDHHEARIYRSAAPGAVPQQVRPHVPEDFFRHTHNSRDFNRGQEKPDPNSFFEPVVAMLNGAGTILVFGTGTGMSSEMDQFIEWAKINHPEISRRIVGSVVIDEHHMSEDEVLAKARAFHAERGAARP